MAVRLATARGIPNLGFISLLGALSLVGLSVYRQRLIANRSWPSCVGVATPVRGRW